MASVESSYISKENEIDHASDFSFKRFPSYQHNPTMVYPQMNAMGANVSGAPPLNEGLPNQRNRFLYESRTHNVNQWSQDPQSQQKAIYAAAASAANLDSLYSENNRFGDKVPFLGSFFDRQALRNEFEHFILLKLAAGKETDLTDGPLPSYLATHSKAATSPPTSSPSATEKTETPKKPTEKLLKKQFFDDFPESSSNKNSEQNEERPAQQNYSRRGSAQNRNGDFRAKRYDGNGQSNRYRGRRGNYRGNSRRGDNFRRGNYRGRGNYKKSDEDNFYQKPEQVEELSERSESAEVEPVEEAAWGKAGDSGVSFGDDDNGKNDVSFGDDKKSGEQNVEFE
ncbi:hypothetical protein MHBO_000759 [Bonamia ostreae]|uniref:Uncharacterized protein n=1 Tax=Bonamia ostreae TaxID=126728 RepID=A0ABV2AHJ2_9EUKA